MLEHFLFKFMDGKKQNAKFIKGFLWIFFFYAGLLSIKNHCTGCCLLDLLESLPYNRIGLRLCKPQLAGIRKLAAYVILGINAEGKKEVLTIRIGENESSKYWLSVLNELKNRGVKDILIICADGLTGIKEAIAAAFPKTEYQRCIVHQVRNTLKYVPDKDRKAFATDLKTIYQAADEKKALAALDRVMEKWTAKYPNSMKRWKDNWDAISPIFKFSAAVRKVIYTTNAIESLNSTYRKLNRQRSVFPSDTALLKALYLATFEATKKWTATIRNWAQVYGELSIMYEGRLPE